MAALARFVKSKTKALNNDLSHAVISKLKDAPDKINEIVDAWVNSYSKEHTKYQSQDDKGDDDIEFSNIYHALIHSPALETLLQLEHSYSVAVKDLLEQKDGALDKLQKKCVLLFIMCKFNPTGFSF